MKILIVIVFIAFIDLSFQQTNNRVSIYSRQVNNCGTYCFAVDECTEGRCKFCTHQWFFWACSWNQVEGSALVELGASDPLNLATILLNKTISQDEDAMKLGEFIPQYPDRFSQFNSMIVNNFVPMPNSKHEYLSYVYNQPTEPVSMD